MIVFKQIQNSTGYVLLAFKARNSHLWPLTPPFWVLFSAFWALGSRLWFTIYFTRKVVHVCSFVIFMVDFLSVEFWESDSLLSLALSLSLLVQTGSILTGDWYYIFKYLVNLSWMPGGFIMLEKGLLHRSFLYSPCLYIYIFFLLRCLNGSINHIPNLFQESPMWLHNVTFCFFWDPRERLFRQTLGFLHSFLTVSLLILVLLQSG